MGEISSELKSFKESVDPQIGKMKSSCSNIKGKIQSIGNSTNSAKSGVSNCYDSANKSTIMSQFDYVGEVYNKISSSLGDLEGMISGAEGVCSMVSELESINAEIAAQQKIVNSNLGDSDGAKQRRSAAQRVINEKNQLFDEKHAEAKSKLAALKGSDSSIAFDGAAASGGTEVDLADVKYGTFEKKSFTASNGVSFDYFIYVPKCETTEKLPVMLYMHGAGFDDIGDQIVTYGGLGEAIKNQTITPKGIVVMPHIKNGRLYEKKDVRDALAELPLTICDQYNADKNRISVGGVSYGGVTSYRLVNEHPGEFAAVATACGAEEITSAFNGVKVWSTNGRNNQNNHTGRKYVGEKIDELKSAGVDAQYTLFDDVWAHTKIGTYSFQQKLKNEETGEEEYLVDWAMKQSKA